MKAEKVKRASYTLEYRLEAVRLVHGGQSCAAIAKVLGMPSQTLENSVRQAAKSEYGWPRVWRLMKEHDIKARGKHKFIVTTNSTHSLPIAPNLLSRNFRPDAPNRVGTSDIAYIQTGGG